MPDRTPSTPIDDDADAPRFTIEDTGSTVDAADLVPDGDEDEELDEDTAPTT